jgi:hypothetical protein
MNSKKSVLQRSALFFSAASFIASLVCAVFLYLKIQSIGWEHPVSASFLAGIIFFLSIGFVFFVIGKTNMPSFKVGTHKPIQDQ